MQEAICGIKPKTSFDQESDDELPDLAELGITDNQQRQLGLLFYVLYGNSAVLYSPNSSLINDVISKANSTFILLDTITKYAYERFESSQNIFSCEWNREKNRIPPKSNSFS